MSRPLRIEFPGACYYVTARGNAGQEIFTDIEDGREFLKLLGLEIGQQKWICHGYCLLENHFHLLIETPNSNLGRGMGRLNMRYSQWFGRRHQRPGHLFQGRYKAIIFEKDRHLQNIARHVVSNPVRTGAVNQADQWRWSSYRALATGTESPKWLTTNWILNSFSTDTRLARNSWKQFVKNAADAPSPWTEVRGGHYLGSEEFLQTLKEKIGKQSLEQVPSMMADPTRPTTEQIIAAVANSTNLALETVLDRKIAPDPFKAAIYLLRRAANLSLKDVAAMGNISPGRVSQIQRQIEDAGGITLAFSWGSELATLVE